MAIYQYYSDITTPPLPNEVFVFGSNLRGVHGAGAAKDAYLKHGAKLGVAKGLCGMSYAIPTKDAYLKAMDHTTVRKFVHSFLVFSRMRQDMKFYVTKVGCGLARNRDEDIAAMFVGATSNCRFHSDWAVFLEPPV